MNRPDLSSADSAGCANVVSSSEDESSQRTCVSAQQVRHAIAAAGFMCLIALFAHFIKPTHKLVDEWGRPDLETMVPRSFGQWTADPRASGVIVSPDVAAALASLYTRTLTRTYINPKGAVIMLSIAYGEDQRDDQQAHIPDVCYPAQGFQILGGRNVTLQLRGAGIPARQIETVLGERRYEPVTYWTMVGDHPTLRGIDKKLAEMRYTLSGRIPDGLLFRVSSLGRDSEAGYALQNQFIQELFASLDSQARIRLGGVRQ